MKNKYIFGPVNSRRFGLSLGIDLSLSSKQCNFDCVYCELEGKKAIDKQTQIAPLEDIIDEIKQSLNKHPNINVITLTANGEPTMYPKLKELIANINIIKKDFNQEIQTLILSNASSINDKNIQNTMLDIDIVKLSLDSVDKKIFKKIDRPHKDIKIKNIINGILEFKNIHKKMLVIEILFVKGINDKKAHIKKLNKVLKKINPHRVDISSIDRPPAYNVSAISNKKLFKIARKFSKKININVAYNKKRDVQTIEFSKNEILNMIQRRPQDEDDINMLFSSLSKSYLEELIKDGKITTKTTSNTTFYVIKNIV